MLLAKMAKRSLVLFAVIALAVAGCTSDDPGTGETTELSGHLVIYTSEPQDLAAEMLESFIDLHPGVTYEIFRSGTGNVVSKIDTELQTGSTEADIIWFADIGYIQGLDDQGLIEHYVPKGAESIDQQYAYNDGMAHEVRLIYNVLAYNTTLVSDAPTDWMDATDARFKSVFAMANPNYSGGAFTALVVHTQYPDDAGWEFYELAQENDTKYEQSNGNLQVKVSSGEYALVAIVDFMARNAKNEGSPVEVVWPESGAILIPTPVALMSTIAEENKEAAKAFLDYMFELESQQLFVEQGYIPVVAEAGVPEGAPLVEDIVTMPFDLDYYVTNATEIRNRYVELFGNE